MARKSFFRRVGEFLGIIKPKPKIRVRKAKKVVPPTPVTPAGVEARVLAYAKLTKVQRSMQRPDDEGREFWSIYDEMGL